jgi:hypothetical protein
VDYIEKTNIQKIILSMIVTGSPASVNRLSPVAGTVVAGKTQDYLADTAVFSVAGLSADDLADEIVA